MTKFTLDIEDAIDLLERLKRENYAVTIQALEMAIKALETQEKLKNALRDFYISGDIGIDAVSCKHCRLKNNGCPVEEKDEACPQSDEEAIELFFKYGLGCEL